MNKWQRLLGKVRLPQFLAGLLLALSFLTGCAAPGAPPLNPYTYTGAGLGALLGAGVGAAANHSNPWRGAAIGALIGGAGGGIAGEMYGRSNPYYYGQQQRGYYQQPNGPPPAAAAPAPGYGYNAPAAPQSYASSDPPPDPSGGIQTPVTQVPYYR